MGVAVGVVSAGPLENRPSSNSPPTPDVGGAPEVGGDIEAAGLQDRRPFKTQLQP